MILNELQNILPFPLTNKAFKELSRICSRGAFELLSPLICYPFKRQSHKMVKHNQTIRQQIADELFECVWLLCEIGT